MPVERQIDDARREEAGERAEQTGRRPGHDETDGPAGHPDERALDQELAGEAATARAERRPQRDLARAPERPRERQVGDVRAGNQQHETGRAEQRQQDRPGVRGQLLVQPHDVGRETRLVGRYTVGAAAAQLFGERRDLGGRVSGRAAGHAAARTRAGSRTSAGRSPSSLAASRGTDRPTSACRRRSRSGTAESAAGRRRSGEAGRSTATTRPTTLVVAAELLEPVAVAQHQHRLGVRRIVVRRRTCGRRAA